MSTLREPVGPKDRKVYMRRRALVLAGLVALIAVVVLIIVKPGSSGGVEGAADVEVPDDLADIEQGTGESGTPSDEPAQCAAGQLLVLPLLDEGTYAPGQLPQLSLSIENTGDEPCSTDAGTAGMEFRITSGSDEVWRSTDCQENGEHLSVLLEPGKPLETEPVEWDRTRSSAETCGITREPVGADGASYHLHVKVNEVEGRESAQFLLY